MLRLRTWAWCIITTALVYTVAQAAGYPERPVRMIVGFTAGSGPDSVARTIAPAMSEQLGQTIVVENRAGAGGSIGTELALKSPSDGYTLLLLAAADTLQPALRSNLPYNLERDLVTTSLVASSMAALTVHPSVPARNIKELVALAKAHPGKLNYGSSGIGSSSHLMGELLNQMAGIKMAHVPYKGSTESAIATASGQIEISFPAVSSVAALLETGKLRAIAVTGSKRSFNLPEVPTISESGVSGYDRTTWWGVVGPAGMSRDIATRLHGVILKVINTTEMKTALNKQGLEQLTSSPEQFAAFIRSEIAQNAKVIKLSGAKSE